MGAVLPLFLDVDANCGLSDKKVTLSGGVVFRIGRRLYYNARSLDTRERFKLTN